MCSFKLKMNLKAILLLTIAVKANGALLQVRPSETRDVRSLDGLWYFTTDPAQVDNIEEATDFDINLIPVPSSYNDITTRLDMNRHVGSVWYKKQFYVPKEWQEKRVWIRFGSVCYNASVQINGQIAITHSIGHLPFGTDISEYLNFGLENTILVEVSNILTSSTIPQGYLEDVETDNGLRTKQVITFDFFNYAGIDRPVLLYTTDEVFVSDISIDTKIDGTTGLVTYTLQVTGNEDDITKQVNILDKKGNVVAASTSQENSNTLQVENASLWWPFLMNANPGYLYTLEVILQSQSEVIDHYKQPFGIRELHYNSTSFNINGRMVYMRGFGRHEDSDIRGKGMDLPTIIRDHHLIKWFGANCYRTSHYPYAEEIMDMADRLGIMIIDEVPAVNTENYTDLLLENHNRAFSELYLRDKNRPSVVVWSIANEPRTQYKEAEDYYRQVVAHVKTLDTTRPVTIANQQFVDKDYSGQFLDILGVNRYEAWYGNVGQIEGIYDRVIKMAKGWYETHKKPVLWTEYGADMYEGLSILPSYIWSEQYGLDVLGEYFRAFDDLRKEGWFVGELIWNFADFKTDTDIKRVGGNKKGLLTRNRQPKRAAYLIRKRFWQMAHQFTNVSLPKDLDWYSFMK